MACRWGEIWQKLNSASMKKEMWGVHKRCQLASVPCLATVGRNSYLPSIADQVWESNHMVPEFTTVNQVPFTV
ncbi:hypothetical protein TIFTF001_023785 [Ficus carica]|uniref:Uncharacterized protein n=1 Tax=Ficus carica TaxID=3494 RepID=A0AA88DK89_FICCA|nr:hypothetical protein TIFTF001_023785 [Ficus carica]